MKLSLYYHTLKHCKFIQIYSRLINKIPKTTKQFTIEEIEINKNFSLSSSIVKHRTWLASKKFRFLNKEVDFRDSIRWRDKSLSKLWRYNLHYFDYLNQESTPDEPNELIHDWIKNNPIGSEDAWEPYTTSLRIVNWIKYFERAEKEIPELFLTNLASQIDFLYKNLEFHILGNHLLKNLKALMFGATFFINRRAYLKAQKILVKQLAEQILHDGAHFELSPMYHCIVLNDLFDIYNLVKYNSLEYCSNSFQEMLQTKIYQMFDWLTKIVDNNGRIPLLNDSAYKIAPEFSELCEYAEQLGFPRPKRKREQVVFLKESGYCILQNDNFRVLFDCGKIGPDYLPGHAHCDMLSFVMYYKGNPVIVDTGVYEYNEGKRRDYCRSTRAHNTVIIDGEEQAEIWKSFRVGRRGYPIGWERGENWVRCGHTGYERIKRGLRHFRKIFIYDHTIEVSDQIEGTGYKKVESFLHFAPNVGLQPEADGLTANVEGHKLKLEFDGTSFKLFESEYFPEFGKIEKRQSVKLLYGSDNVKIRSTV